MSSANDVVRIRVALLRLADELGSVTEACRIMGYSRDSYYRFRKMYRENGEDGLRALGRNPTSPRNRVAREIEDAVIALSVENPDWGKRRIAAQLAVTSHSVAASTVRSIWIRNGLETRSRRQNARASLLDSARNHNGGNYNGANHGAGNQLGGNQTDGHGPAQREGEPDRESISLRRSIPSTSSMTAGSNS